MKIKSNFGLFIWGALILLLLSACQKAPSNPVGMSSQIAGVAAKQRQRTEYLAYEHRISVVSPEDQLIPTYHRLIDSCSEDEKYQCTILHTSLNSGDDKSGDVRLRILPEGVGFILDLASAHGKITNQSVKADDLGDAIVDNSKRLDMLKSYRERLLELEQQSGNDIDSLVKIASELSSVQSDLEYAEGRKANLLQRVQMDVVQISLIAMPSTSFWQPISNAFGGFGSDLSEGISEAVTGLAYMLPWSLLILFFVYLVRVIWRRGKTK